MANLLNYNLLNLNEIASKSDAVISGTHDDLEVDTNKLSHYVLNQIEGRNVVLVGHLLPHVISKDKINLIVVLRCSPEELKLRYSTRGYSDSKINDNIMSEILDICLVEALNSFGADSIIEIDTSGKHSIDIAKEITKIYKGQNKKTVNRINWLNNMSSEDDIQKYLN